MPALPADLVFLQSDWLSSNHLLCLGGAPALIDTGHVKHADATLRRVRRHLGAAPLAAIAHTHLHSDHCGGTAALQAAYPRAATWVPAPTLAHVAAWDEHALTFGATGQRCARFGATGALAHEGRVMLGRREWLVFAAPGHDALAVLLFQPDSGVLVAGDALWEHGVGVVFETLAGARGFEQFMATLDLIERLDPAVVVPGHGAVFGRADGAVAGALARARARVRHFAGHPAQHALYAAKVLVKYQLIDAEAMTHADFARWLERAPLLRALHPMHRPGLPWDEWLRSVLEPMFDKGHLARDATHVRDGTPAGGA